MNTDKRILFKTLWGSHAHGTNIETSDIDYRGIFFHDRHRADYLFGNVEEFYSANKDENYDSIFKVKKLLEKANPDTLQLIFAPEDIIVFRDSILGNLFKHRQMYVTKSVLDGFIGYANEQITKATGLNKKTNYTEADKVRQPPINFVSYTMKGRVYKLVDWLKENNLNPDDFTFNKIDGMIGGLCLYNHKTKGLFSASSNEPRCGEVPAGIEPILEACWFNNQAYSEHCKKHKSYLTWLEERNVTRYVNTDSGQTIDGKNMLHARRMVDMGFEIARTGQINIKRPNRDELLSIRYGKVSLSDLVKRIQDEMKQLAELKASCDLPDSFDQRFSDELFFDIYTQLVKK